MKQMTMLAIAAVIIIVAVIVVLFATLVRTGPPVTSTPTSSALTSTATPQPTAQTTTATQSNSIKYTVSIGTNSTYGSYLANTTGFTLYAFTQDVPNSGTSDCYGGCAGVWPPFYSKSASIVVQDGINPTWFTSIDRTDGTKQLAYNGYPLYYYAFDKRAGQVSGQGVGSFYVMATSGKLFGSP